MLKIIAGIEILQGIVAIGLLVFVGTSDIPTNQKIIGAIFISIFIPLALFAGIQLWKGTKIGIPMSLFFQFIQTPKIDVNGFGFDMSLALEGILTIVDKPGFLFELNLISLVFFLILLIFFMKRPKTESQNVAT